MNMNTFATITVANIEATLRATITKKIEGEKLIICSTECLDQINLVIDRMITITGFDEAKLTDEDLSIASVFAENFTKDALAGNIVNGILLADDSGKMDLFLNEQMPKMVGVYTPGIMLPIVLVGRIMNELKQFTR